MNHGSQQQQFLETIGVRGSGDPDAWVSAFERYTDFTEWGPQKKLAALKTTLQGRAGQWLKEVGGPEEDEVDEYEWP